MSKLLTEVRRYKRLWSAWKKVEDSGRSSKSGDIRRAVSEFRANEPTNLKSLQSSLGRGRFTFAAARGVTKRKSSGEFRPVVLAPLRSRIVQRSMLDVLNDHENLKPLYRNPYSFGGIGKAGEGVPAAVPAAVEAVLSAIGEGAAFGLRADIKNFYGVISQQAVKAVVSQAVDDPEFVDVFARAIRVELENTSELGWKADLFPTGDVGVAQGSSLSPLLGNIILADFDRVMNEGDCRCIRYVDDFFILAPDRKAAKARLKKASRLLNGHGMILSASKTDRTPIQLHNERFDFLGVDFATGYVRPGKKSRDGIVNDIEESLRVGKADLIALRDGKTNRSSRSFLRTLQDIETRIQGWGKQYRRCNDTRLMEDLDRKIDVLIDSYMNTYLHSSAGTFGPSSASHRTLLGIGRFVDTMDGEDAYAWPKRKRPVAEATTRRESPLLAEGEVVI